MYLTPAPASSICLRPQVLDVDAHGSPPLAFSLHPRSLRSKHSHLSRSQLAYSELSYPFAIIPQHPTQCTPHCTHFPNFAFSLLLEQHPPLPQSASLSPDFIIPSHSAPHPRLYTLAPGACPDIGRTQRTFPLPSPSPSSPPLPLHHPVLSSLAQSPLTSKPDASQTASPPAPSS